jgi:methyl-accepting chemotaxis protein
MHTWTVGKKLYSIVAGLVLLLALVSGLALFGMWRLEADLDEVASARAGQRIESESGLVRDPSRAAIATIVENQRQSAERRLADGRAVSGTISSGLLAVGVLATIMALAATSVIRGITRTLRVTAAELSDGAQQVASASSQVSGASQSLSQGATEQAASLEQTSASMEEMASMTRRNAENSQQAAAMMAETERLVHGANDALEDMVSSMAAIKSSSDRVAKIIKTIDEIAFQTNILALNAAVEAARAGEAGMGFAVVADEVRALAHRSAQAARDTAGLIEESIGKANEGQQKVHLVTGAIASITASTVRAKSLVDEVSEASRQQAQGIDQVSQAVAEMEQVTQRTAATAEESAAAGEELNAQAESSMQAVGRLMALVGGRRIKPPAPAAGPAPEVAVTRPEPARIVTMDRPKRAPRPVARLTAEEQIPLEDTGTFGSF